MDKGTKPGNLEKDMLFRKYGWGKWAKRTLHYSVTFRRTDSHCGRSVGLVNTPSARFLLFAANSLHKEPLFAVCSPSNSVNGTDTPANCSHLRGHGHTLRYRFATSRRTAEMYGNCREGKAEVLNPLRLKK
jgi:hypothetical protein